MIVLAAAPYIKYETGETFIKRAYLLTSDKLSAGTKKNYTNARVADI